MAIADKLNDLITQRNNLADNLNTMGVSASQEETLTTLVPKVLEIQTGGGSEITKGIIINECDSDGFVIDISIVGMTTIPDYYFYQAGLSTAWLSRLGSKLKMSNVASIGQYAFYNCTSLSITSLPNSVASIGSYAFNNCPNLALTSLPNNLTLIGQYAFYECSKLAVTELPSGVTSIDSNAFYGCTNLALTSLPNSVTSIGSYAFNNCPNLTIKTIPSGVTKLNNSTFRYCSKLTEITVLGDITSIGTYVFESCSALKKFVLPNITGVPTLSKSNAFTGSGIGNKIGYIYVPDTMVSDFQSASNWSVWASQIKGISELGG
jgi:hypothetical protein